MELATMTGLLPSSISLGVDSFSCTRHGHKECDFATRCLRSTNSVAATIVVSAPEFRVSYQSTVVLASNYCDAAIIRRVEPFGFDNSQEHLVVG